MVCPRTEATTVKMVLSFMIRLMILVVVGTSQGKITLFMEILAILIFKLAIRCRPLMMPCGKKVTE